MANLNLAGLTLDALTAYLSIHGWQPSGSIIYTKAGEVEPITLPVADPTADSAMSARLWQAAIARLARHEGRPAAKIVDDIRHIIKGEYRVVEGSA